MFMDPELWAHLYRQDRLADHRGEALRQLAEQAMGDIGFRFFVGTWLIRLGHRIRGTGELD